MTKPNRDLFIETFEVMKPGEGLLLHGEAYFPAQGQIEVMNLDLSRIIPSPYIMTYGQGVLRERSPQPRANPIDPENPFVEVSLQRENKRLDATVPMVLEGEGSIGDTEVRLLSMAFRELYVVKPSVAR